ncbi:MAG: periplasmic heavy metal sensor [Bacteroidota bacterium]
MTRPFHPLIERIMNPASKNKLLLWLIALLVVANIASITLFWLGKGKQPSPPKGTPNEFLVKELKLDTKQQEQLELLVKEHRQAAEQLRTKTREAKEAFFDLLKQPTITDSIKKEAAQKISVSTEELDLLTLAHFQKIRALCNPEQQKNFDQIIHELTRMMGQPRPPMGQGNGPQGPPPGGPDGDRPPPPEQ